MNPFLIEYRRLQRYSLMLLVVISLAMTVVHYFVSLSTRLDYRQELLNASAETLEQEISPYHYLLGQLKFSAEQALQFPRPAAQPITITGMALSDGRGAQAFTSQTSAMLHTILDQVAFAERSLVGIKRIAYVSVDGLWYQPRSMNFIDNLMAQVWRDIGEKTFIQQNLSLYLHSLINDQTVFALSVPVMLNGKRQGSLVMEFDLPALMMIVSKSQPDRTFFLLNEMNEVKLASQQGKLVSAQLYDGAHQHDNLKSLQGLPLALNVQYDPAKAFRTELFDFILHFMGYALALFLLVTYQVRRFKTKVLAPFAKLMIHISRLSDGNLQGVRRVSEEWRPLFRQVDDIARADAKANDE